MPVTGPLAAMPTLYAIPAFTDNYIWTLTDDQSSALVVDPGDAEPVIAAAETHGWRPTTVLVTHHHPDHVGGLPELRRRWPSLRIIGPEDPRITGLDEVVNDGDQVRVEGLDLTFRVMAVPGHTLSHIAYVGDPWLFCGDTLFSLGCGRLFEGTPAQMLDSLDRVAALPGEQLVCCTHEYTAANGRFAINVDPGNPALVQRIADVAACRAKNQPSLPVTLASERACNPFLRCDQPSVQRSIAAATGSMPADRLDSFARLRRMKDAFRG